MSIFSNWKPKAKPHINCREVLWQLKSMRDSHERFLARVTETEDGAKLIALRKYYKERCFELQNEISSMREAVERIDEAIAQLTAHEAWQQGYAAAEEDMQPYSDADETALALCTVSVQ